MGGIRKRALTYLPAYVVPAALGLAVVPFLTRLLGPAEFGIYAVCLSVHGCLLAMGAQPTSGTLNRFYAHTRDPEQRGPLVRALLGLSVVVSTGLMLAAITGAVLFWLISGSAAWGWALIATAAMTAAFTVFQYLLTVRYVEERAAATSATQVVHSVGKAVALVGGALAAGTAAGSLGAYAVICVAMVLVLLRGVISLQGTFFSRELWTRALRYGAPLIVVALSFVALAGVDRLVLASAAGEAAAGQYAAAYLIADGAISIPAMLLRYAVYTSVVESHERGDANRATQILRRANDGIVIAAVPVVVLLGLLGDEIIGAIGGEGYAVSNSVPFLIALGLVAYRVGAMEGIGFELTLESGGLARSFVYATAIAVPLTIALVLWADVEGAALATFLSYAAFYVVMRVRSPVPAVTAYPIARLFIAALGLAGVLGIGAVAGDGWALVAGGLGCAYAAWRVARP